MPHYFSKQQNSPLRETEIEFNSLGSSFKFITASGVFSKKFIDKGTEVLLSYAQVEKGSKLLDLGCGWGAVGIVTAKVYDADVLCSDINKRAVMLTKKNAKINGVSLRTVSSDGFEKIDELFDIILLNPPQTAGRDECIKLIDQSIAHLKEGGSLQMVARHKKGGETLSKKMEELSGNVETIGKKSGFRVYKSVKLRENYKNE